MSFFSKMSKMPYVLGSLVSPKQESKLVSCMVIVRGATSSSLGPVNLSRGLAIVITTEFIPLHHLKIVLTIFTPRHLAYLSIHSQSSVISAPNSLPTDNILDLTKLKAFADVKLKVARMMISHFDGVENIVVKGENAGYQHFSPFPTLFSKAFILRVVKSRDCVVKS